MSNELRYQVALNMLPSVGSILAKQLVSYCGSAQQVFHQPKAKLAKIPGIGPKTAEAIYQSDLLNRADKEIEQCKRQGVDILFYTDHEYPKRLKSTVDCPLVIYSKGKGQINPGRSIAIVGTRNATDYGKEVTMALVEGLSSYNCTIISGLAYGIDITAHKAALQFDTPTLAVLGSGVDIIYPSTHGETAKKLQENGALLSEYPTGTKPEAYHFPARNRIIAGMTDATVVIEAAEKGGALITADIANSYNREVFALPGNLSNPYSLGCNRLIQQQKAIIYTSVEELAKELNWDQEIDKAEQRELVPQSLSNEEQTIFNILIEETDGLQIDQLAWKSQFTVNQLASVLLSLEFSGYVKSLPGKRYQIKRKF